MSKRRTQTKKTESVINEIMKRPSNNTLDRGKKDTGLKIVQRNIDELIPAEYNPRQLSKKQYADLKASLQGFGFVDPVLINIRKDRKNIIIGGHQRVAVAKDLGFKEVPCIELNLPPEQEKELNIRLNRNTGEWNFDSLANYFDQDNLIEWGFENWQFGEIEFQEPETVQQNIAELEKIREQRKKGDAEVKEKTDTEKYLVIVFQDRQDKINLLKSLGLPEDERYIPSGGVQIIPSGKWISKLKSSKQNKSGATG